MAPSNSKRVEALKFEWESLDDLDGPTRISKLEEAISQAASYADEILVLIEDAGVIKEGTSLESSFNALDAQFLREWSKDCGKFLCSKPYHRSWNHAVDGEWMLI